MDLGISGRAAVITGGAGGMGMETARLLLGEGVRVLLTDLDGDELATTADLLGGTDDTLQTVVADLTSMDGARAIQDATDWDIDILVHTAGVTGAKGDPLADIAYGFAVARFRRKIQAELCHARLATLAKALCGAVLVVLSPLSNVASAIMHQLRPVS